MMDSERSLGSKRIRGENYSASGSSCYGEAPVSTDGCASFISKPVNYISYGNLAVLEDLRRAIAKTSAFAAECKGYANVPEDLRQSIERTSTFAAKCIEFFTSEGLEAPEDLRQSNEKTSTAAAESSGCVSFISKPISFNFPCFENLEVSKDLRQSLEKISTAAAECSILWNSKITNSETMVPLSDFQKLLESHELLWHSCILFEEVDASQLLNRTSLREYDVSSLSPFITFGSHWEKADKDYWRVREICQNLHRDFNGEQVGQLAPFLDYLIMILEEQRFVIYSFVLHLRQLEIPIVRLKELVTYELLTNKSNVDCDASDEFDESDGGFKYPHDMSENPAFKCIWRQKHVFDSLYIMSRESSSLLKEVEDNSDSSSTVNDELRKILGIIKDKEFMNARRWLRRFCGRKPLSGREFATWGFFLAPKSMHPSLRSNFKILDQLHSVLQGQVVSKSSVPEMLIGCFHDVLSKGKLIERKYLDGVEHKKQLLQKRGSLDIEAVSEITFAESVKETSKQIDEAVQKLALLRRGSVLSEDLPHRNISLLRVLFESSLVNLQLDLIRENLGEAIDLGVKLLRSARLKYSEDLNQLHLSIVELIESCNRSLT